MKRVLTIFFGILYLIALSSCVMTREEATAYYGSFTDQEICVSYMTADSLNIYQEDRKREIQKRQVDCRPYIPMAQLELARDAAAYQRSLSYIELLNSSQGSTSSGSTSKICMYNPSTQGMSWCHHKTAMGTCAHYGGPC